MKTQEEIKTQNYQHETTIMKSWIAKWIHVKYEWYEDIKK
jgi:hypothetical protein